MFFGALCSPLIALIASTVAVSAAPGLSLKVTGSDTITDVENLKVVTTITNTGTETLKLLNDPLSPLSKLPAKTFTIADARGHSPAFVGIRAKYVPSTAIAAGQDALTILHPGQSINVNHDLSEAYNFTLTSEGAYTIEARNLFYVVDAYNKASTLYANTAGAHITKLFGKLAVARPAVSRRMKYTSCTPSQQLQLVTAASQAQTYANTSSSYASTHTSNTTRYTTWFGPYTNNIAAHFSKLNDNTYSSYNYDCSCTDRSTYAYVYPDEFGTVTLCGAFWSAPMLGTDSKGGTLIHESSHFTANGGTEDYAYGQSACKELARINSSAAINNADSHEYFAENSPSLS
ncbi:peptidyl-Lys metalloendopeptidase [Tricholoma matsutake]|nr:peptidyl-Lys metalloendopeptidase [Tricholoma matsutake 945]